MTPSASSPSAHRDSADLAGKTLLLTGVPRSGSSLACRLAGGLPDTVALSEPIPRSAFAGLESPGEACAEIAGFATRTRQRIAADHRAPSLHVAGRLDDNVVVPDADGGLRRRQAEQGEIDIDKPLSDGFALVIKHNALFAALLPGLTPSFRCFALVRNPLVVLASWQTVDLPVHVGRIPAGEQYDAGLREALDGTRDTLARQLAILDWFFARYADNLPSDRVLRYEDLIASGGATLYRVLGHSQATPHSLASRNAHAVYRDVDVDALLARLLDAGGAWTGYYDATDCERAAAAIRAG